ncbi:gamma-glutamylcyclotransferase family protein [Teredinibacter haidensis]|uniref:gamma-glutamylcyclotransferase family protein n=1 Tax=Teredinibacter haidensis TaxID=2731755 RepID=UPI000948BCF2|nr:gamma-glutamylcyclotransferase family protein [Teredinibacter haidensis]
MHLFVYGSLMYPRVWRSIVKGRYGQQNAELKGYRCVQVRNQHYPMIYSVRGGDSVEGQVYFHVRAKDIKRLTLFEGKEYTLRPVHLLLDSPLMGSRRLKAATFVASRLGRFKAGERKWNRGEFVQSGLDHFCKRFVGFNRI